MNARTHLALGLSILLLPTAVQAQKEGEKPPVIEAAKVDLGRPVDFEKDVLPFLEENCIACHNLAIDEGKLSLEDVEGILKGGKRGPSVVAGKPDQSLMYQFASRAKGPVMPPVNNKVDATPLTPRELGLLRKWIEEGAKSGMGGAEVALAWSPLPAELRPVYSLAFSPWADTIAVGRANRVVLHDTANGAELGRLVDPALSAIEIGGEKPYEDGAAHRDFVHAVEFNPDGSMLATAGYRVVKLWERVERAVERQQAAGGTVTSIAVSKDGKWAAFGSEDKSVKIWNLADGKIGHTLAGHTAAVTGLDFTADASKLVSGSKDKTLRVWDLATGKEIAKLDLPAESNDLCLNADGTQVVSADQDNKLRVWAVPTAPPMEGAEPPKPIRELAGHGGPVTAVALIGAGPQIVSGSMDKQVRTWDANSGRAVRTMNHAFPVTDVASSPDGAQVASAGENGTAKIWTVSNGQQVLETAARPEAARHVVVLTGEQTVAKQKVALADAAQKEAEKNLEDRKKALETAEKAKPDAEKAVTEAQKKEAEAKKKLDEAKKKLAAKPDDANLKKAVTTAETEAQKQADELNKAKTALEAAKRAVELAKKSVTTAEGKLAERKKQKETADARQKQVDGELETAKKSVTEGAKPIRAVAFAATGQLVTAGDDNRVSFWSAKSGQLASATKPGGAALLCLATLPDGRVLDGGADKKVSLLAANDGWKLVATLGPDAANPLDVTSSRFVSRVLCLDFSPDGKWLVTGGGDPSRSGELLVWDVQKRALAREFEEAHSDTVFDVEFSHDGRWLVSGAADKFVKLFDANAGTFVRSYEGHTHHVLGVSIKADDSEIVSGGADTEIKVWNRETGEQKRTIKNYGKEVTSIDYIGVLENTVSSGGDKTVRLHRTTNGQNYRSLSGSPDFVYAATAARDGSIVAAGGADGAVRVWNDSGQLLLTIEPPALPTDGDQQAAR